MREHPQHLLEAINYSLIRLRFRLSQIDAEIKYGTHGATDIERAKILEAIAKGEALLDPKKESK